MAFDALSRGNKLSVQQRLFLETLTVAAHSDKLLCSTVQLRQLSLDTRHESNWVVCRLYSSHSTSTGIDALLQAVPAFGKSGHSSAFEIMLMNGRWAWFQNDHTLLGGQITVFSRQSLLQCSRMHEWCVIVLHNLKTFRFLVFCSANRYGFLDPEACRKRAFQQGHYHPRAGIVYLLHSFHETSYSVFRS